MAIIWDRTFDDPVAFFTFVLSCFTLALVIVSAIQIRFLIRGDKTARITAEAADLSAQAAIGIELPRLFSSVKVNRVNDSLWSVVISVTNYGRTPALVTHQSADISHEPLPSTPQYNAIIDVGPGTIIPKDGVRDLVARDNNSLSVFTDESIRPNTFFWVYGIILYRDFINKKHGAKFCYRFVSLNESGSGFMIVPEGPEAYTESY
ncbi:hypothetical protein MPC1_1230001 [Methylocella tundrae]|nr:hypothetical protein MPC1_1230001 [Methylocella tundrae]